MIWLNNTPAPDKQNGTGSCRKERCFHHRRRPQRKNGRDPLRQTRRWTDGASHRNLTMEERGPERVFGIEEATAIVGWAARGETADRSHDKR